MKDISSFCEATSNEVYPESQSSVDASLCVSSPVFKSKLRSSLYVNLELQHFNELL